MQSVYPGAVAGEQDVEGGAQVEAAVVEGGADDGALEGMFVEGDDVLDRGDAAGVDQRRGRAGVLEDAEQVVDDG